MSDFDDEFEDYQEGTESEEDMYDDVDDDEFQDEAAKEIAGSYANVGLNNAPEQPAPQATPAPGAAAQQQAQVSGRTPDEKENKITIKRLAGAWPQIRTDVGIKAKNKKIFLVLLKTIVGLGLFIPRPLKAFEMDPLGVVIDICSDDSLSMFHAPLEAKMNVEPLKGILNAALKKHESKPGGMKKAG